jgi:hypothetical protein
VLKRAAAIVSTFLLASGCLGSTAIPKDPSMEAKQVAPFVQISSPPIEPYHSTSKKQAKSETKVTQVTLAAIGDILIHDKVYIDAKQKDGTYNFNRIFDGVSNLLQVPDILVANQETMIGGKELRLSTYPAFNSPHEIGDALKLAGVDVVTLPIIMH